MERSQIGFRDIKSEYEQGEALKDFMEYLVARTKRDIDTENQFQYDRGRLSFGIILPIDIDTIENPYNERFLDMAYYRWRNLYDHATRYVSALMIGKDNYFHVKYIPRIEVWDNFTIRSMREMHYRLDILLSIAPESNVPITHFIYDRDSVVSEWRCGSCNSPNVIDKRHCTQCGAPRMLLAQEMMCLHCGAEKVEGLKACDKCGAEYD